MPHVIGRVQAREGGHAYVLSTVRQDTVASDSHGGASVTAAVHASDFNF